MNEADLSFCKGENMQYFITFLEGIITFISPCILPMIPLYISYFAGGGERKTPQTVLCAAGFVIGFTLVFVTMGALAGTVGSFLITHQQMVNLVSGAVVMVFGLHYMGVLKINLFRTKGRSADVSDLGFFSSLVFGLVFSIGWTPCVGAFLGSALMLASQQGQVLTGVILLLCYSLGLGIPFLLSAVLIDKLKGAFDFIKRHYKRINTVCGILLIMVGLAMATGLLGRLLTLLS